MHSDAPESISKGDASHETAEPTEQLPGGMEKTKVQSEDKTGYSASIIYCWLI